MPFIQDDENQQNAPQGGGSIVGGQAPSGKAPASSGSFANINKYLEANKPQAAQMGQQVAGSVEQSAQQAQQQTEALKATPGQAPQAQTSESIRAQLAAPTQNAQQYQQMRQTGGYTGPQSVEQAQGYQEARKTSQEAAQKVGQLGTESGRMGLVEQQFARPQYALGQKRLDTSLVSRNADAKGALEQAGQKWQGIENMFSNAANQAGTQIAKNVAQANANKQLAADTENQVVNEFRGGLQAKADEYNRQQAALKDALSSELGKDYNISQDTLDKLGLMSGQQIYNLNLGNYITPEAVQATVSDVATPEQRQYWGNLMNLLGRQDNTVGAGQELKGTQIDMERLKTDLSNASKEVQQRAAAPVPTSIPGGPTFKEVLDSGKSMTKFTMDKFANDPNYQQNIRNQAEKVAIEQYGLTKYKPYLDEVTNAVLTQESKNLADQMQKFRTETSYDRRVNPASGK